MMQMSDVRRRMEQQVVLQWGWEKDRRKQKIVVDEDQDKVRLAGGATCPVLALA